MEGTQRAQNKYNEDEGPDLDDLLDGLGIDLED